MSRVRSSAQRGRGDYPDDWPEISRRIKAAAGWRCERCGHPAEGPWKMSGRALGELQQNAPYELDQAPDIIGTMRKACDLLCDHPRDGKQRMLTVHHLDMDKANVADWNLAALCQGCHLSIQGRVDFEQQYMFVHSAWMMSHVAGFKRERGL